MQFRRLYLFLFLLLVSPWDAVAADRADIIAGLNALPLLANRIHGDVVMAVIYDPANNESNADAENVRQIIAAGVPLPGGGKLSAISVGVTELHKLSRAQIAFVTKGLGSHFSDISTATSAASILTITTDLDCVSAAKCILGVSTQPKLTIYYSKAAADAAKIEFLQEFSMVVRQL